MHFVACEKPGTVLDLTAHLPQIDRLAQERDVRLLVVDPLVATMPAGKMSSHKDQDVRSVLAPLAYVAEQRDLAALGLMHFSKSATDALLGVGGSIGFVGDARSVLIFGANPGTTVVRRGRRGSSLTASATSGAGRPRGPAGSSRGGFTTAKSSKPRTRSWATRSTSVPTSWCG